MTLRVIRKHGLYVPGDLLVATPARIRELAFCKFAEPCEEPVEEQFKVQGSILNTEPRTSNRKKGVAP